MMSQTTSYFSSMTATACGLVDRRVALAAAVGVVGSARLSWSAMPR